MLVFASAICFLISGMIQKIQKKKTTTKNKTAELNQNYKSQKFISVKYFEINIYYWYICSFYYYYTNALLYSMCY